MAHDVAVERAGPADAGALLALINVVQPHVPWDRARLAWQFFAPPCGPARLYVLRDGDAIVALFAAIPQRLRIGGATVPTWMVQDVMTHPDHRGRGYLHRLGQRCLDDLRADGATGYTFPNKLSEGSFRRLGWTAWGPVPWRGGAVRPPTGRHGPLQVVPLRGGFDDAVASAWEHADVGIGVHRDAAFLNWRYSKPGAEYDCYRLDEAGFLVLKPYRDASRRVLHVCDLVVQADARHLLADALAFVHARAAAHGAERITAWLPADHPYAGAFDDAGLTLDQGHDRTMFVTGVGEGDAASDGDATAAGHARGWHVTQGDSDVY